MIGRPLVLSKSSIERWLECHYAWYLEAVLRLPAYPSLDMLMGTVAHAAAEAHWKGTDPLEAVQNSWDREVASMPTFDAGVASRAVAAGRGLFALYREKIAPTFHPTLVEAPFLITVNGVLVSGIIDAADTELDEVHDTKTTATPSKVQSADHRLGMTLYRWGYQALVGRLPKRLVLDVIARNGRTKIVDVEPDERGTAETVGYVAERIGKGDFEPTGVVTGECPRCPYLDRCKYGVPYRLDTAVRMSVLALEQSGEGGSHAA